MISQTIAQKYLRLTANWLPWAMMLFFFVFSLDSKSILEFFMHNLPTMLVGLAWWLSTKHKSFWLPCIVFLAIGLFFVVFFQGWVGLYLGALCVVECAILILLQRAQK